MLGPVSVGRNFTREVIPAILKTRKEEGCNLQTCDVLRRDFIRDHFA